MEKPSLQNGVLVIPLNGDPRFQWWRGGLSIYEVLVELNAPLSVMKRYVSEKKLIELGIIQ